MMSSLWIRGQHCDFLFTWMFPTDQDLCSSTLNRSKGQWRSVPKLWQWPTAGANRRTIWGRANSTNISSHVFLLPAERLLASAFCLQLCFDGFLFQDFVPLLSEPCLFLCPCWKFVVCLTVAYMGAVLFLLHFLHLLQFAFLRLKGEETCPRRVWIWHLYSLFHSLVLL